METDEYLRLKAILDGDVSDALPVDEVIRIARRMAELSPESLDAWWALANATDWVLRGQPDDQLREHPLFEEMIAAYDHVIQLDPLDAAGPYNKARNLYRAGALNEAYEAYMLAGVTEQQNPSDDVEWPASWHFESAAEVALDLGDEQSARRAAEAAMAAGAQDANVDSFLHRINCDE